MAILGSILPWSESIVLSRGGRPRNNQNIMKSNVMTIVLKTYTNQSFYKIERKFRFCNISSLLLSVDGLGRYGDPINPDGDPQEAMDDAAAMDF